MTYLAVALVLIFAAYIFRNYSWRLMEIRWYGTETDAVVSRIEEDVRSAGGATYPRRFFYVSFQTKSALQNEARLLNPTGKLVKGSKVRVRYLEDRADAAVLMK